LNLQPNLFLLPFFVTDQPLIQARLFSVLVGAGLLLSAYGLCPFSGELSPFPLTFVDHTSGVVANLLISARSRRGFVGFGVLCFCGVCSPGHKPSATLKAFS